jgi:heme-degrading monooxygenase HmoA
MVLEVAILPVRAGQEKAFEETFAKAQPIIMSMPGYVSHKLHKGVEAPQKYMLLVEWKTIEDHTVGFRQSAEYQEWRRLLHHFYDPAPIVEHFTVVG